MSSEKKDEEKAEDGNFAEKMNSEDDRLEDVESYKWTPQKKHVSGTFVSQGVPVQDIECDDYTQTGCVNLSALEKIPEGAASAFLSADEKARVKERKKKEEELEQQKQETKDEKEKEKEKKEEEEEEETEVQVQLQPQSQPE
ncbi:hypothetical protein RFI_39120, partial [Reticulomyxa filosa]